MDDPSPPPQWMPEAEVMPIGPTDPVAAGTFLAQPPQEATPPAAGPDAPPAPSGFVPSPPAPYGPAPYGPAPYAPGPGTPGPGTPEPHHAEHHGADHHVPEGHGGRHGHSRLQLAIALSIAVVSVLGAVVGWRAEVRDAQAGDFDQGAVAASITAAQIRSEAEAQASLAESNYARYQRLGDEAARLDGTGCPAADGTSVTDLQAQAVCDLQVVFSGYNDPAYLTRHGGYDTARYAADVAAAEKQLYDADPAPYRAQAAQARHREYQLLLLSLGLVVALALFTVARIGRSRRRTLALAVPGWLLLAAGVVVLGVLEL